MQSTQQQQPKNDDTPTQPLGSQSSIYSLTLDEFQNTLSESGKNFGSMNMDEFLNSIWTAEENHNQSQAQEQAQGSSPQTGNNPYATAQFPQRTENALLRQGSLSVPAPLCSKTVDEVWSEIHKTEQAANNNDDSQVNPNPATAQRQSTFGDMTLEDFLVRAGIVRAAQNFAPYNGMMQQNMAVNVVPPVGPPTFIARPPMMAMGVGNVVNYQAASPASSGGPSHRDGGFGGGRKRIIDGPVEKVVERRQRRMIKNRESAARSRARKQVEIFAPLPKVNKLRLDVFLFFRRINGRLIRLSLKRN
ncbi:abscisic acid-insensitive 5-like protein 2 [Phtheirospermum japonicum]|uniref:Abscisic acid-insensitive 5-like protein 2 n=1 Tax=Phtheirospermum japonicum TaxID=374723 RepID=A0A830D1M3_9LAMI|nr:abscisic acid-insensitive 5-like protein 2 [Phtheirospermum japonicum]